MLLPETPRCKYTLAPLHEVLCQLSFPRLLKLETELPNIFQERLLQDFPFFEERKNIALSVKTDNEGANDEIERTTKKVFEFISEDRNWKISLQSDSIALTCSKYDKWEDFSKKITHAFDNLVDIYGIKNITRVGLRYKDVIDREILGTELTWNKLLKPHIAGVYGILEDSPSIESQFSNFILKLDNVDGRVQVNHGLVEKVGDNHHYAYLIDGDFFCEGSINKDEAYEQLSKFNVEARKLFRWSISDELHELLQPTDL